jgi:hypothetical protein
LSLFYALEDLEVSHVLLLQEMFLRTTAASIAVASKFSRACHVGITDCMKLKAQHFGIVQWHMFTTSFVKICTHFKWKHHS